MQRGIGVGVIEIKRMTERAIEQRRHRRGPCLRVAEHGGFAASVERECFEHFQQRRRGLRVAPRADRAAEKIQRQHLGALPNFRRYVLEFQVRDIGGERSGFMGHGIVSAYSWLVHRSPPV